MFKIIYQPVSGDAAHWFVTTSRFITESDAVQWVLKQPINKFYVWLVVPEKSN